jgi:hypothetical protein
METTEKRSSKMKSKMLGFAAIAVIVLLSVPSLTLGGSEDYLVPVTIRKANRTLMKGYIVLSEEEIQRMGSWVSGSFGRRGRPWTLQKVQKNAPRLLEFERITFREGSKATSFSLPMDTGKSQ